MQVRTRFFSKGSFASRLSNSIILAYIGKVARSEQEIRQLIEAGFEFVCDYEDRKVFRKRN